MRGRIGVAVGIGAGFVGAIFAAAMALGPGPAPGITRALSPLYRSGNAVGINTTSGSITFTTIVVDSALTFSGGGSIAPVAKGTCSVTGSGTDCTVASYDVPSASVARLYQINLEANVTGCSSCASFNRLSWTDGFGVLHTTQPIYCMNASTGTFQATVNSNGGFPCATVTIEPDPGTTISVLAKHSTGTGYTADWSASIIRVN